MKSTLIVFVLFLSLSAREIRLSMIDTPPVIDGMLSDTCWEVSSPTSGFIQMEPEKGKPSSEKTMVYVAQTEDYLYIGMKCFMEMTSTVTANISARDQLEGTDDLVFIMLDTFNDLRTCYAFAVNPIGTQTDMYVTDDGRTEDRNWDTEWQSAVHVTDSLWSAEFAIPFRHIKYDPALTTWGVNFGRSIRHNSEIAYWSGEMNNNLRVSQSGKLTGLVLPGTDRNILITPYATLRNENSDLTGRYDHTFTDIGLDAAYQLSSGVRLDGTINPDFATVEGDQQQLNLTRWELSFPEKRLFFLEGNSLYSTRIQTFYSRRIGDIDYGGKVTGKIDDYNFSLLTAQTSQNSTMGIPSALFSAFRLKKDILRSSSIGITAVDKSWENAYTRSFSADMLLNPGTEWKITGQFVASTPGLTMAHSAWFMRVAHESNLHHVHIRYSDTGEKFKDNVNKTGFILDDDMREIDSDLSYTWWTRNSWVKYLKFESQNNVFWSHKGTLRSWYVTERATLYLQNRFGLRLDYNDEFKLYEKKFYNHRFGAELGYNADEWEFAACKYSLGRNYDRDFELYQCIARKRFYKRIAIEYSFEKLNFLPDKEGDSETLHILSVDYNFTRDLWLRLFNQTSSRTNRFYIYGLFGWRFIPPFSSLYLIYTSDRFDELGYPQKRKNDIVFLKISYQFGI